MIQRRLRAGRWAAVAVGAACCLYHVATAAGGDSTPVRDAAARILRETGTQGGLVVHLGCGGGELTAALRADGRHVVQGLDADEQNVAKARRHVRSLGVCGPVSIRRLTGGRLPYADNLVNLLVAGAAADVPAAEIMRVLRPKGVAYVKRDGGWAKTVKPWPKDMDEWTHWLHGPDGNAVADDRRVGPPRSFQWSARPIWSRHHNTVPSVSALVSAKGRVFCIVDDAPPGMSGAAPDKWSLVARDAFNGIELWRIALPDWGWKAWTSQWEGRFNQTNQIPKRLVAVGDRVYATLGFNAPLTALEAATGKVLRTYESARFTDEVLVHRGVLIVSLNDARQEPGSVKQAPPVRKSVAAIQAESGKLLWKRGSFTGNSTKTGPLERVTHLLLCALGGRIFLLDGDEVVCLDAETGSILWKAPRPQSERYTSRYQHCMSEMCTLVATDKAVLLCQLEPIQKRIGWRVIKARVQAYSPKTGKAMWDYRCGNWGHFCVPDLIVAGDLAWVHDKESMSIVGVDLLTGTEKRRLSTRKALDNGHHHRCYRNKATVRYLMTSYRGLEFIDWSSNETSLNHWVRGACRYGAMPCNGMVYTTPHPCDCYIGSKLNGMLALAPVSARTKADESATERLVRGPAWGAVNPRSATRNRQSTDWPTYRHDTARTGHAGSPAPATLKVAWQAKLRGPSSPVGSAAASRLSGLTVADAKVFVAAVDAHTLHALDARSGERVWNYVAGGRVDTPPTVWEGLALFGCRDGSVHCLRASDGKLVWRFRAAPAERLVGAFGGLESAWPVHGSVLVSDGKAYVTAGRSSFLDGGIRAWCLDPRTGEVLAEQTMASPHDMQVDAGRNQNDDTGLVADLLVSEGRGVYMRQRRLFAKPIASPGWGRRVSATAGMLDDSWFNRTVWLLDGQAQGDLMVCDETSAYAVRAFKSRGHGGFHTPGTTGYELVAAPRTPPADPKPAGKADKLRTTRWKSPKPRWSIRVPLRINAMAVAGGTLLCAGRPDAIDPDDPWAAYEGRRGGTLLALDTADGSKQAELALDGAPVHDALAVARGRAYLTTTDGRVLCIGEK